MAVGNCQILKSKYDKLVHRGTLVSNRNTSSLIKVFYPDIDSGIIFKKQQGTIK